MPTPTAPDAPNVERDDDELEEPEFRSSFDDAHINLRAFDNHAVEEADFAPLPNDGFSDVLGRFEQITKSLTLALKYLVPGLVIALIVSSSSAWAGWHRPQQAVYHEVVVYCHDTPAARSRGARGSNGITWNPNAPSSPQCQNGTISLDSLLDLTKDQKAQIAISKAMLPIIVHNAFTIGSADTNLYGWANFVLPYLKEGSPAANYLSDYLHKDVAAQIQAQQTVTVRVDTIPDPSIPGQYTVGWISKISNGVQTAYRHTTATINVEFGPVTKLNTWGIYLSGIDVDDHGASNAQEFDSLQP
jgi:hypothetical protein